MPKFLLNVFAMFLAFPIFSYGQSVPINLSPHQWIKNDFLLESKNSTNFLNSYSPILFEKKINESLLKVKLGKNNSIFIVYKTSSSEPEQLINFIRNGSNEKLNSHFVVKNESLDLKKGNKKAGLILSYTFNNKKNEEAFISINNNFKDPSTSIYEIIIFNERISKKEKKGIETYLALKYGISLVNSDDYQDENSDKLWNSSEENFNQEIFGIGKNDYYRFFNSKSKNATDSLLSISLSTKLIKNRKDISGRKNLNNKEYIIIGSNSKSKTFKAQESYKILDKKWMLQNIGNQEKEISFSFSCNELGIDTLSNPDSYKLIVNSKNSTFSNFEELSFIDGSFEKDKLIFNLPLFNHEEQKAFFFTLFYKKKLRLNHSWDKNNSCFDSNNLQISIKDGTGPYTLILKNDNETVKVNSKKDTYTFENLKNGNYQLHVIDSFGLDGTMNIENISDEFKKESIIVNLDSEFIINEALDFVEILPDIQNSQHEKLKFQWTKDGVILSSSKKLKANKEGIYNLLVTNELNCSKNFETQVKKKSQNEFEFEDWKIFPNPVENGNYFTIQFDFKEPTQVQYYIYSIDGKNISSTNLGTITKKSVQEMILQPGIYRILVSYKNTSQIKKIIVN